MKIQNYVRCLLVGALTLTACATTQVSSVPQPQNAVPDREWSNEPPVPFKGREKTSFRKIQDLYQSRQYEEALGEMTKVEARSKQWKVTPQVQNLYGLLLLAQKSPKEAIQRFQLAIQLSKNPSFNTFLRYNLATAEYEADLYKNAQTTLQTVKPSELDPLTRIKYFYLKALTLKKLSDPAASSQELFVGTYHFKDTSIKVRQDEHMDDLYTHLLESNFSEIPQANVLEAFAKDHAGSPLYPVILFEIGKRASDLRQPGMAESYLGRLVRDFPQSKYAAEAGELLKNVQGQSIANGQSVGVLLPLSGRFEKFGKRALQGIQLGFRVFNQDEPDSKVTLYVEDSGETEESTLQALNKLYYNNNVSAVIGPLLSKGVEAVTKKAQELGLPMLSLSQQAGTEGTYVFQFSVTARDQARAVARYAFEKTDMRRFAILYPQGKFGEEYLNHFWDAVEELGGKITGVESYSENETDFRSVADRLLGLYYKDDRIRETRELEKFRRENNIKDRNRRTEKYFKLPPVVDFQGLFIPDEAKIVGQILPTLAFRDVEVDSFKPLGISTWNSEELIKRADRFAGGSIFVDTFFLNSDSDEVKQFITRHEKTFGVLPTAIEALSFDAATLLDRALGGNRGSISRSQVRENLVSTKDFKGVTGKVSYRDGKLSRDMRVLTVVGKQILEAQEPHLSQ